MKQSGGFSLIEVLVAVAIVGIALPALLYTVMQRLDGTAYMRERMVASWVAVNQLTEQQLKNLETREVDVGQIEGEEEMAGTRWRWSLETTATNREFHYQIEVNVWREDDTGRRVLASMIAYSHDFDALLEENEYAVP